jgi:copper homeostasis protein
MKLEVIGFNIESCVAAQKAGAHRIELCSGPGEGGTTPSYGFTRAASKKLQIDLYVMIRPRGGDFFFSDEEFEIMKTDVAACKQLNCSGVVFGILTKDGKVDKKRCKELIDLAYPMEATFHRAFDRVADPFEALEDIIESGFERILTSGLKPKVIEGKQTIFQLISQANDRIIIMPGSGLNAENIIEIAEATGATEFHSSASIFKERKMDYQNSVNESLQYVTVNEDEVKKMVDLLIAFESKKTINTPTSP